MPTLIAPSGWLVTVTGAAGDLHLPIAQGNLDDLHVLEVELAGDRGHLDSFTVTVVVPAPIVAACDRRHGRVVGAVVAWLESFGELAVHDVRVDCRKA